MAKGEFVGFRALDDELKKLKEIKEQTGLSMSEILRSLVQSAIVEPVTAYKVIAGGRWSKKIGHDLHHG